MQDSEYIDGLLSFIKASPTPFHAVEKMSELLREHGFKKLNESDVWSINDSGKYYVTRNGSSIVAFTLGKGKENELSERGFRMVGAHTDSPCLKVKPKPEIVKNSYLQLGVEIYGGVLLHTWFDRDLSLAGRVNFVNTNGEVKDALIDFVEPVAIVPSLAIHLNPEVHTNNSINKQKHILPVLMKLPDEEVAPDFREMLLRVVQKQHPESDADRVLDYELSFYDTQAPAVVGLHKDFITGARLDNLLSCYTGLMSLLQAGKDQNCLLVCNDHEEVGSQSAAGAQGRFLRSVLDRLKPAAEDYARMIDQSMFISADNAHGIHPNYAEKYDDNHGPVINQGPVIKVNVNQRYATSGETSAAFRYLCAEADVPVQSFVVRNDMACGSTIGPITASQLGVRSIDVGVPTFAMHSIRELAGCWDGYYLYRVLREYFQ